MASTRPKTRKKHPKHPELAPVPAAAEPDEHAGPPPTDEQAEEQQAVAVLTQGERALAQATTVEAVKDIRDRAGAVKRWLRDRRHRIEDVNAVMRLKLMAERKLGALLAETDLHQGDLLRGSTLEPRAGVRLKELGIKKTESHRWQLLASIPKGLFEKHCKSVMAAGKELTAASLYQLAGERVKPETAARLGIEEAMRRLSTVLRTIIARWPEGEDAHDALVAHLRALAHEIETTGGVKSGPVGAGST